MRTRARAPIFAGVTGTGASSGVLALPPLELKALPIPALLAILIENMTVRRPANGAQASQCSQCSQCSMTDSSHAAST